MFPVKLCQPVQRLSSIATGILQQLHKQVEQFLKRRPVIFLPELCKYKSFHPDMKLQPLKLLLLIAFIDINIDTVRFEQ